MLIFPQHQRLFFTAELRKASTNKGGGYQRINPTNREKRNKKAILLGSPEIAGDVEKYLVAKLKKALDESERAEHRIHAKPAQLSPKFKRVKELLDFPNHTTNLREKLYTLENLLGRRQTQLKKNKNPYSPTSLSLVFKFAKLDMICKQLYVVDGSHITHSVGGTSNEPILGEEIQVYRWSDEFVDETKVHGIHVEALYLQKRFISGNDDDDLRFSVIGVVGMIGIGKTTLSQLVFNKPEVKNHFFPRIWVCVSKQPNDDSDPRREIVRRMLISLGVEETLTDSAKEKDGLKVLLLALRMQLTGKRYLIVLDDVWSEEEKYSPLIFVLSVL
ncbi:putative disease resistance protein RGA1 [Rhododendron vialii]|uniref:putative disease resistance protein RGA1 n=1 Tax=Rhododendron vialii TaxID=182163 RepID=UPI00265E67AC|nr:putative disease resistance protein RGA1 [Rhododendron vialii]